MYVSGHIEILNDIFSQLPKNYFDKKFINRIYNGVEFVDSPCGLYKYQDKHIHFKTHKICGLSFFFELFDNVKHGEGHMFQFHKGFFAHLHSMTTDPDNTVNKIRNKIVKSILAYSLLALYGNRIFDKNPEMKLYGAWVGMIMHIITDSYSPAHTIRHKNILTKEITSIPPLDKTLEMRLKVHEEIKRLAKLDKIYTNADDFHKNLLSKFPDNTFVKNFKHKLWGSYKLFKFEYDTRKVVDNKIKLQNKLYPDKNGDIITFQYYPGQTFLSHSKYDLMYYIKNDKELYERMINECKTYLILLHEVIETKNIKLFLSKVMELMLSRTFHISSKNLNNKTNYIRI